MSLNGMDGGEGIVVGVEETEDWPGNTWRHEQNNIENFLRDIS